MQLDPKALLALQAVLTEGTVTAAAARLHRTQSVVSRQLLGLETRLGFALFHREKQRLIPTEAGIAFFREAERALSALTEIGSIADAVRQGRTLPVRILAPSHVIHGLLPGALNRFAKLEPDCRFILEIRQREYISHWIRNRQYDLGIAPDVEAQDGVVTEPLIQTGTFLVMPADHPLAIQRSVRCDLLGQHRMVALHHGTPMRSVLERALSNTATRPTIWVETGSVLSACHLAIQCGGVALADPFIANLFAKDPKVAVRALTPHIRMAYSLIRATDHPFSTRDEKLVRCILAEASSIIANIGSFASRRNG